MPKKPKLPSLVLIEWLDPKAHNDGEPAELDLARVRTIGWLTHEAPDRLVLSQEFYTDEHSSANTCWRSSTVILKSLVRRKVKLRLP
jgi:hypothetical protein